MEEDRFETRADLGSPTMLGLCADTAGGAFYAFDETAIYEVNLSFLDKLDFSFDETYCVLFTMKPHIHHPSKSTCSSKTSYN